MGRILPGTGAESAPCPSAPLASPRFWPFPGPETSSRSRWSWSIATPAVPIESFQYLAWFEAPGRDRQPEGETWKSVVVESRDGRDPGSRLVSMAPERAVARLPGRPRTAQRVRDQDEGRPPQGRLPASTGDHRPRGRARLEDPRAIAGAKVIPLQHGRHLFSTDPDETKQVETGLDGTYQVRGVDPGVGLAVDASRVQDSKWTARRPTDRRSVRHRAGSRPDAPGLDP